MKQENLLKLAQKTIETEIRELEFLKRQIDDSFIKVLNLIYNMKGKLVVVGIGKSAHVANKIVATLNSTGTPSQFLHAAEAIHGDLGLVRKEDVVLCISNSGNSSEIVQLAPYLKEYASVLIGMTGNEKSKLAEISEVLLLTKIEKEACPNQLAPTSSTTVQMVLGDALAVCLMEMRAFKDYDFAKFHPGGSLGKNLTATVEQFISSQKPEVCEKTPFKEVVLSISGSKHGVTVVTRENEIIGIITDGDLRRMLLKSMDFTQLFARDLMTLNPKKIDKNELAKSAMKMMKENNIGQLIVTSGEKYVGIIDLHKLLDEGIL